MKISKKGESMGENRVKRTKINTDWEIKNSAPEMSYKLEMKKFSLFLKGRGYRDSTIEMYLGNIHRYLKFSKTPRPSLKKAEEFREMLLSSNLSRSTLNQYSYSMRAYHQMLGDDYKFSRLNPNNTIPYYFSELDVEKIFSVITNLKHLALFATMFYGCLRVSELINLQDRDLDLNNLTIRVNNGKGGKDGIVFIKDECASILKEYLRVRPKLEINGVQYLFFTDYGNKWNREDIHHLFTSYKKKAGVEKRGGLHVWGRHTPATIMIANGCDLRTAQMVLRHSDIRTTLRYVHISETVKRQKYEQFLTL
jgi:integrase/recombinase XerD